MLLVVLLSAKDSTLSEQLRLTQVKRILGLDGSPGLRGCEGSVMSSLLSRIAFHSLQLRSLHSSRTLRMDKGLPSALH